MGACGSKNNGGKNRRQDMAMDKHRREMLKKQEEARRREQQKKDEQLRNADDFTRGVLGARKEDGPLLALAKSTHFNLTTLRQLEFLFNSISGSQVADEVIDKDELAEALGLVRDSLLARTIFRLFDVTQSKKINFRTWVITLSSLSTHATNEEKVKFSFSLYDMNNDGTIDIKELGSLLESAVKENIVDLSDDDVRKICDETLRTVDLDGNGEVDYSEYRRMIEQSPDFIDSFSIDVDKLLSAFTRKHSKLCLPAHLLEQSAVEQRESQFRQRKGARISDSEIDLLNYAKELSKSASKMGGEGKECFSPIPGPITTKAEAQEMIWQYEGKMNSNNTNVTHQGHYALHNHKLIHTPVVEEVDNEDTNQHTPSASHSAMDESFVNMSIYEENEREREREKEREKEIERDDVCVSPDHHHNHDHQHKEKRKPFSICVDDSAVNNNNNNNTNNTTNNRPSRSPMNHHRKSTDGFASNTNTNNVATNKNYRKSTDGHSLQAAAAALGISGFKRMHSNINNTLSVNTTMNNDSVSNSGSISPGSINVNVNNSNLSSNAIPLSPTRSTHRCSRHSTPKHTPTDSTRFLSTPQQQHQQQLSVHSLSRASSTTHSTTHSTHSTDNGMGVSGGNSPSADAFDPVPLDMTDGNHTTGNGSGNVNGSSPGLRLRMAHLPNTNTTTTITNTNTSGNGSGSGSGGMRPSASPRTPRTPKTPNNNDNANAESVNKTPVQFPRLYSDNPVLLSPSIEANSVFERNLYGHYDQNTSISIGDGDGEYEYDDEDCDCFDHDDSGYLFDDDSMYHGGANDHLIDERDVRTIINTPGAFDVSCTSSPSPLTAPTPASTPGLGLGLCVHTHTHVHGTSNNVEWVKDTSHHNQGMGSMYAGNIVTDQGDGDELEYIDDLDDLDVDNEDDVTHAIEPSTVGNAPALARLLMLVNGSDSWKSK